MRPIGKKNDSLSFDIRKREDEAMQSNIKRVYDLTNGEDKSDLSDITDILFREKMEMFIQVK